MIKIEKYDVKMIPEIWDVYFTSIRMVCNKDYSKEQVEAWAPVSFDLDLFRKRIDKLDPLVATLNGKVVGYTDLQNDGLIDHFFVHGEFQGKGVGAKLMEAIFIKGKAFPKLYSHVSHTAKPFYLKHGFSFVNVRREYVRGTYIENSLMVKEQIIEVGT